MRNVLKQLSQADVAELTSFLIDPKRPDGTLCFQELQGFLFAVTSAPEMILPAEWLPIISNEEDLGFSDHSEAQRILELVMSLYNQVNFAVLERSYSLPPSCEIQEDLESNFEESTAISQWSRGFMLGHDWLAETWDELAPEPLGGESGSCAMVLSFFATRQLAEVYYLDMTTTPRRRKPRISFNEFAEKIRDLFPGALSSYSDLGRTISEVITGDVDSKH